jgi:uncharacterized protein YndB with AHSA1/START domain
MSDFIVKHRVYIAAPVSKVFSLLASGDGWTRWFTQNAYVEPKPGGTIRFEWREFGADRITVNDEGHVVEVIKDKTFAFTWQPGKHPTTVTLRFEPRGNGCIIDVQEAGYELDRDDVEAALAEAAGWGEAMTLFKFYVEHGLTCATVPLA